jgi:hypothetical protein
MNDQNHISLRVHAYPLSQSPSMYLVSSATMMGTTYTVGKFDLLGMSAR